MERSISKSLFFLQRLEPKISVMDRYIIIELIGPFLFGVGLFSSIGVTAGAMFELVRKVTESGLPISIALQVFFLKVPEFIGWAFPMAMVLSTLMVYSQMSSNSEIVALRSCGISVYRMLIPAVILGLTVTGLTFALNEVIVPNANYQASLTLERTLDRDDPPFREEHIFYPEFGKVERPDGSKKDTLTRLFYAEKFDGKYMRGVTIVDRSQYGVDQIVSSESATWNPAENIWDLFNGTIYIVSPDGSYRNIVKFDHQELKLSTAPLDLAGKRRTYQQMNIPQSYEYLELMRLSGNHRKIVKTQVRIQQKFAVPFVCLVLGLVGAALGIRPQRNANRGTSFGISVIIIFAYYLLSFITGAMGQKEVLTPFLAGWLPNFMGIGVAMLLIARASR
ncbi:MULTISPECIES: LptF/LptG family permease [Okeania]|uniref:YjgP/YjgQ family permease n=1 Tax=Okeania hirsuta TaxID=1458930 RepID=A0A3N6RMN8_9CYAN|nr:MULTISPECIES: LptF/LptG family permease [Okeania]NES76829.1 YjgP/YjgQ family permease [Okeania sp. SIO1H4]NES92362.1 YjgP/YjgQ family permease [Okeania sp. SIO2B9]NET20458.1 YjgP/YjgQ family permease [Okeania sp. SIO1H5]NET78231.1 YjgP/YjgQ family permease [Okeania sp. SIO1F9]NET94608.1 YjgP/YjgQ family permease [Okeania sp. SIO1H2]